MQIVVELLASCHQSLLSYMMIKLKKFESSNLPAGNVHGFVQRQRQVLWNELYEISDDDKCVFPANLNFFTSKSHLN